MRRPCPGCGRYTPAATGAAARSASGPGAARRAATRVRRGRRPGRARVGALLTAGHPRGRDGRAASTKSWRRRSGPRSSSAKAMSPAARSPARTESLGPLEHVVVATSLGKHLRDLEEVVGVGEVARAITATGASTRHHHGWRASPSSARGSSRRVSVGTRRRLLGQESRPPQRGDASRRRLLAEHVGVALDGGAEDLRLPIDVNGEEPVGEDDRIRADNRAHLVGRADRPR